MSKNKNNFNSKHLNFKSPNNDVVEIQSDKTSTTQINFFVTTKQMGFYVKEIRQKV